jgi:hypothetical protein
LRRVSVCGRPHRDPLCEQEIHQHGAAPLFPRGSGAAALLAAEILRPSPGLKERPGPVLSFPAAVPFAGALHASASTGLDLLLVEHVLQDRHELRAHGGLELAEHRDRVGRIVVEVEHDDLGDVVVPVFCGRLEDHAQAVRVVARRMSSQKKFEAVSVVGAVVKRGVGGMQRDGAGHGVSFLVSVSSMGSGSGPAGRPLTGDHAATGSIRR